eukprot:TRINITY_DN3525_c0_g1_i1.p1 TRINITY_DN3525_c0_g1~~TRINITY_DN3525_c0_g1_i1.p1  ORF type:complete len:126 (-),score=22.61 TRINITY_DN3525_c0_g1_i1:140-517(-)
MCIRDSISVLLLKNNEYEEALNILQEVEELEKELYGEDSLQIGKTCKLIGTLYIISEAFDEAQEYLLAAYRIFESKGQEQLMKEVASKLKIIGTQKSTQKKEPHLEAEPPKPKKKLRRKILRKKL